MEQREVRRLRAETLSRETQYDREDRYRSYRDRQEAYARILAEYDLLRQAAFRVNDAISRQQTIAEEAKEFDARWELLHRESLYLTLLAPTEVGAAYKSFGDAVVKYRSHVSTFVYPASDYIDPKLYGEDARRRTWDLDRDMDGANHYLVDLMRADLGVSARDNESVGGLHAEQGCSAGEVVGQDKDGVN
jgi:hypothetical protein